MALRIFALIFALFSTHAFAGLFDNQSKSQFVPVDQAFAFDFQQSGNQLNLNWQIKSGYYLYRQQIKLNAAQAELAPLELPKGTWHEDEFYGKTEIYTQQLNLPITIQTAAKGATVSVTYQGCAEAGFCYPPETRVVPLNEVVVSAEGRLHPNPLPQEREQKTETSSFLTTEQKVASSSPLSPGEKTGVRDSDNTAPNQLPFSALWAFLIGIGIAFTPCVLPMYPLISGIVLGGKQRLSTTRALFLTFVYVQGIALTYTALGLVVAAAGLQFQAALQHPYVLIGLSALFVLLAASMFGLFTLQLPSSLQTRLTLMSNRQQGGSAGGVFAMGALAGLICSPCTTAPLSAILLYIAQSGNMWLGGGTLYLYALGMGLPLMLITVFGNRLLPKSGPWMETVKIAFGFVILALPVFLLERILGETWGNRLWGLLGVAFFSWAFITSLQTNKSWIRIVQIILLGAALVCARPVQDWVFGSSVTTQQAHLNFTKIATVEQLDTALANAKGQPVMLDLYADWCVACKEFEKYTFSDPKVQQQLANTVLLQADVTANNAQDVALLKHLQVLGLPTILFFDAQGREQPEARVTGFMDASMFDSHLRNQTP